MLTSIFTLFISLASLLSVKDSWSFESSSQHRDCPWGLLQYSTHNVLEVIKRSGVYSPTILVHLDTLKNIETLQKSMIQNGSLSKEDSVLAVTYKLMLGEYVITFRKLFHDSSERLSLPVELWRLIGCSTAEPVLQILKYTVNHEAKNMWCQEVDHKKCGRSHNYIPLKIPDIITILYKTPFKNSLHNNKLSCILRSHSPGAPTVTVEDESFIQVVHALCIAGYTMRATRIKANEQNSERIVLTPNEKQNENDLDMYRIAISTGQPCSFNKTTKTNSWLCPNTLELFHTLGLPTNKETFSDTFQSRANFDIWYKEDGCLGCSLQSSSTNTKTAQQNPAQSFGGKENFH